MPFLVLTACAGCAIISGCPLTTYWGEQMNEKQKQLLDESKFRKRLVDLIFDPKNTQADFEEKIIEMRGEYISEKMDEYFRQYFASVLSVVYDTYTPEEIPVIIGFPYTENDFLYTSMPYQDIDNVTNRFKRQQLIERIEKRAKEVGVKNFKALFRAYEGNRADPAAQTDDGFITAPLEEGGEVSLYAAGWHISEDGSQWRYQGENKVVACVHKIVPVKILTDIDTGEEFLKLYYVDDTKDRYIIKPRKELFNAAKIIELATFGVSVSSQSAKALVGCLCDIEGKNRAILPRQESVSRLGYFGNGLFAPYTKELDFHGEQSFKHIWEAVQPKGNYDEWLACALGARKQSRAAQIVLAASFASVLIGGIGKGMCFFVHLWGGDSATGKTVGLMLAASVWGNPTIGAYPQTFNSTQVGQERLATFLHDLPMCVDELQLARDRHGKYNFDVYQLTQGAGRTRGTISGGIEKSNTWSNCFISTGESPITSSNSAAGEIARVLDIECTAGNKVVNNGAKIVSIIRQNYGRAGEKFINSLTDDMRNLAVRTYENAFAELTAAGVHEKQAMAAAMVITGDVLADKLIFKTGNVLTADMMKEYTKRAEEVSIGRRGLDALYDWVALNRVRFYQRDADGNRITPPGECYGMIEFGEIRIISAVYRRFCEENGFSDRALLSQLDSAGLLQKQDGKRTSPVRIGGSLTRCVILHAEEESYDLSEVLEDDLP